MISSFKGRHHTEEAKKKISESHKGKRPSDKTIKASIIAHKGKKWSLESRKKLSESRKGMVSGMKGKVMSIETRKKLSVAHKGCKSYLWKGGVSNKNSSIRNGVEFRLWRESVFTRDDYTCKKCGQKGGKLNPHHIFNFSTYLDLRFAIDNGITLCKKCHREFHKIYGIKNNTKGQLEEFLIN